MNDVEKKLTQATLEIANLLVENGLSDWKIKLNSKRTSLAETFHSEKTILFSKHFLLAAEKEQVIGVTLHEATHALLGKGHGHDNVFKKKCIEISPNADYAQRATAMPLRRFILTCPKCGQSGSNSSDKTRYCGKCFGADGSMVAFKIKENELKVKVW